MKFKPLIAAAGIIATLELLIWTVAPVEPLVGSNLLESKFLSLDSKTVIVYRVADAIRAKPDVLQVGDSSGQRGIIPSIVSPLIRNQTYANASLTADLGYLGHYETAKAILDRTPSVKMLVFYATPFAAPINYGNSDRSAERQIASNYSGLSHYLVPPSERLRTVVNNYVYYGDFSEVPGYPRLDYHLFRENGGWVPHELAITQRAEVSTIGCHFDWISTKLDADQPLDILYLALEKFALLARSKNIPLVVAFSPVPCRDTRNIDVLEIERQIARFRQNYPDVIFPFPLITTYPSALFADWNHLWTAGAKEASQRLGLALAKVVADAAYRGQPPRPVNEVESELQKARTRVDRPESCQEKPTTTATSQDDGSMFINCIGMHFVGIPAGEFVMGSCKKQSDCPPGAIADAQTLPSEEQAHPVKVQTPFQMGETPVTVEQFTRFLDSPQAQADRSETSLLTSVPGYSAANAGEITNPVTMINWEDAQAFVHWLNKVKSPTDKGTYRLPSEAEWEYAARAGSQEPYWWGSDPDVGLANCIGCSDRFKGKISPVASFPPNLFGLFDMNGNVWEWTADCYREGYGAGDNTEKPLERPGCKTRSLRGGSAEYPTPHWSRATSRLFNIATSRHNMIGFRVVRELPQLINALAIPGPSMPLKDATAISNGGNAGQPEHVFDNKPETFWMPPERGEKIRGHAWLGAELAKPAKVHWIKLRQLPKDSRQERVRVEKSTDGGVTWSPAGAGTFKLRGTISWLHIGGDTEARHWRVVAEGNNGATPPETWAVFKLWLYPARQ